MSQQEERIAILENKASHLDAHLNRILSHLQSEDGTVERVKRYFVEHIETIQKELSDVKTQCALINQTLDNNKWWNRSISLAVVSLVGKLIYDLITK